MADTFNYRIKNLFGILSLIISVIGILDFLLFLWLLINDEKLYEYEFLDKTFPIIILLWLISAISAVIFGVLGIIKSKAKNGTGFKSSLIGLILGSIPLIYYIFLLISTHFIRFI